MPTVQPECVDCSVLKLSCTINCAYAQLLKLTEEQDLQESSRATAALGLLQTELVSAEAELSAERDLTISLASELIATRRAVDLKADQLMSSNEAAADAWTTAWLQDGMCAWASSIDGLAQCGTPNKSSGRPRRRRSVDTARSMPRRWSDGENLHKLRAVDMPAWGAANGIPGGLQLDLASDTPLVEQLREMVREHGIRLVALLHAWDLDADGVVSKTEFGRAIGELAPNSRSAREAVDALFDEFDADGSGAFDYRELKRMLRKHSAPPEAVAPPPPPPAVPKLGRAVAKRANRPTPRASPLASPVSSPASSAPTSPRSVVDPVALPSAPPKSPPISSRASPSNGKREAGKGAKARSKAPAAAAVGGSKREVWAWAGDIGTKKRSGSKPRPHGAALPTPVSSPTKRSPRPQLTVEVPP